MLLLACIFPRARLYEGHRSEDPVIPRMTPSKHQTVHASRKPYVYLLDRHFHRGDQTSCEGMVWNASKCSNNLVSEDKPGEGNAEVEPWVFLPLQDRKRRLPSARYHSASTHFSYRPKCTHRDRVFRSRFLNSNTNALSGYRRSY
jgi:hypothetical protein